jgi:Uri superfamily endonuclease
MKGSYCILAHLPEDARIRVGALGQVAFSRGVYAYVGSAQGGIEARVGRHRKVAKRKRWHIDYLLAKAEVFSVIAVPGHDKSVECRIAQALLGISGALTPVSRFGASDCRCASHLVYFGDVDPEMVAEDITMAITMLRCIYPERTQGG